MELRVSAQEPGGSPSICETDPDEKEISDDDDDDRNHKHRRREDARSQSLERDSLGQVLTKTHRKGSKNGNHYSETGSMSSEMGKNYNFNPTEKDVFDRFGKKRPGFTQFSRGPSDLNQKTWVNQAFSGDSGAFWGRGRDPGAWTQLDSRFNSVDIASQMVQQGSIHHPSLFSGRGLPNVSSAPWNAFGFVPGIPNGGMDTLRPIGLHGSYMSAMNPSLNMGLPRQRCRDFEEQGFCLRGDMCPMEHGVNRIVVEDVQGLSQFNLPVSLQSANLLGPPSTSAPTSLLSNRKDSHGKTSKLGASGNGMDIDGTFTDSAANGADFYDPDQPLWVTDSQTSTELHSIDQSNVEENRLLGGDPGPSGDHCVGLYEGSDNTSSSVWGRISSTKTKAENLDSFPRIQSGNRQSVRKPYQKAQCTLFVNGIPPQNNRKEALLSHFRKFGEVIDVYAPPNSERAFVQFSKREEAQSALVAPDAVMGNRFIRVLWANRDNIPDNGTVTGHNMPIPPRLVAVSSVSPSVSVANKGKHNPQSALRNGIFAPVPAPAPAPAPVLNVLASNHPKPVAANNQKAPPPLQKKLESLEVLKEELRKKQEMLEQKRNDFRRKLDNFVKQATGVKDEVEQEKVLKKQKSGIIVDVANAGSSTSSDPDTVLPSPQGDTTANSSKPFESSKSSAIVAPQEPSRSKPSISPLAPVGPSVTSRFKLDNRPTAFKITSPLPNDLAHVAVLKEHFSQYGDLSKVELDDPESSKPSARIYFTTRHSAEKAFTSGKSLKGHNLQFTWLKSTNPQSPLSTSKANPGVSIQPVGEISKTGESEKMGKRDVEKRRMEPDESNCAT